MVKVNLIAKKRRSSQSKSVVIYVVLGLFTLFFLYFVGMSGYVVYQLTTLKNQQLAVERETEELSGEMTANNERLRGFILSKNILTRIDTLNKNKFPYKEYLDQLSSFVPSGGLLKNVDFSNRGWVSVVISLPSVQSMGQLEVNIADSEKLSASPFASVFAETVSKERNGEYTAKLQFEIRTNGG